MPLVSIIITTYKEGSLLENCIKSLLDISYPLYEIIIADNGSNDAETIEVYNSYRNNPRIQVIHSDNNVGYAGGNNLGYSHAKGEIIVFLNPDTVVTKNCLNAIVNALLDDQQLGACQSLLIQLNGNNIDSVGQQIDYLGYGYPIRASLYKNSWQLPPTFYADGAALCVKKFVLDKCLLDGTPFDQDYFLYYEETDLCWRIRLAGYNIKVIHDAVVYHERSPSDALRMSRLMVFHHTKNRFQTLIKNYSIINIIRFLPLLLIVESIRLIYMLKIKPEHSIAILKGILWTMVNLQKIIRKRSVVQRQIRKVNDKKILEYMIIPNFKMLREYANEYYSRGR